METLEPLLAEHGFFRGLSPEAIRLFTGCAANVRIEAGEYLFREGADADRFYAIRHGQVALEVYVPGRGAVTIQTVGPGEVLGWSWLFPPYRWHFDARVTEATRALSFDAVCIRQKCETDHSLGYELMKRLARVFTERLEAARLQILDVYGRAG
ncbi:MAG TPA: cyclic nucleotide-binding domain-containing protein [bacterium]|nr:cyclic nucleotide-binding domain-containing protein [bacterium]